ncbi:MAG: Smr/MutS family protein [Rickettsiales bacterium]|jgi:DNA-nicking Smr family endonuclease|nr:Smr/MutS family protein [Rickettsiales bacterium]
MSEDQSAWLAEVRDCRKLRRSDEPARGKAREIIVPRRVPDLEQNSDQPYAGAGAAAGDFPYPLEKGESLGIDRGTDRKLRAGKIKIDMKVDFHGLTLDEAFDSLLRSVDRAYGKGLRCLLLITGKGKNTRPDGVSIRSQIGGWLKTPALSSRIIKYLDATPRHGGGGALYVLLRRNRLVPDD